MAVRETRPGTAWLALCAVAVAVTAVLVVVAGGYGYHRDELYFLQAGRHLALGYPDQPLITPLLARVANELFGDSLVGLRLASALTAGLVVLLAGLIAKELGGGRVAQGLAAGCMAVSAFLLAVGHLLSTATFDLLAWTAVSWLVVRVLRVGGGRSWLWVGLVAGVGLENKPLVAALLGALLIGVLVAGPRPVLRDSWPWVASVIALALWAPYLVWQSRHGWPQIGIASMIAAGGSVSSQPRWLFAPFQLVLISPLLVPVWAAGWWRLARDPAMRPYRSFAVAYLLLAVVFIVAGGKPYYLAGLYPVLLAAGAEPTVRWVRAGATSTRRALVGGALALSAAVSTVLMLPVVPATHLAATPIVSIYPDAGETVGWPAFVHTVASVYSTIPVEQRSAVVMFTRNYGEAGAIDRFGPAYLLPPAYSVHAGFAQWGPPAQTGGPVIVVGYELHTLSRWFGSVEQAARVDNHLGVRNTEQGIPIWICRDQRVPWAELWPY